MSDLVQISGSGTSEDDWRPWLFEQLTRWPVLDLREIPAVVVVAPHPDDEVLGAGGLLALTERATVVGLSDGEASHPNSPTVTPAALRRLRAAERRAALRVLRGPAAAPHTLVECHLPDGSLGVHEGEIADELARRLTPETWCVAPWPGDGHPDHDAAGRAAAIACAQTGAPLLSYPVWSWHWARPGDSRLPWHRVNLLPLPKETRERKAAAIDKFKSQIAPLSDAVEDAAILPRPILDRFQRSYEVYFR